MKLLGRILLGLFVASVAAAATETNRTTIVLVVGAVGEPEYGSNFVRQVELWQTAGSRANARMILVGLEEGRGLADREVLKETLQKELAEGSESLWLVLIGHGTFDGREARFNLRGPDLTPADLAGWLGGSRRPMAIINCAAASAPFLNQLSSTNRVVITATRSGNELNLTRFGEHFARAIADLRADLDKDGAVSLLEAFLTASSQVGEYYQREGRLLTEHALIDDNGDGLGTPAEWFRGIRATRKAKEGASPDGVRANQVQLIPGVEDQTLPAEVRARRDALELSVARLRESKGQLNEEEYYRRLESMLLELAGLLEVKPASNSNSPP